MAFDKSELESVAHLARLAFDDNEIPEFTENLSRIIDFVDQLNKADTSGVEPMAHPLEMAQRLRSDTVTETDHRDRYQANAPATEAGLYLVPQVIE